MCIIYDFAEVYQDQITSVILMGGSSRVPAIQQAVRNVVGEFVLFDFLKLTNIADFVVSKAVKWLKISTPMKPRYLV